MIPFLAAFSFSALAVVYALDPVFWPELETFKGTQLCHELAALPKELPTILTTKEPPAGDYFKTTYPQLTNLSHLIIFPRLFVEWNSFLNHQRSFPSASWHGHRFESFHVELLIRHATFPAEGIFLFFGIFACSRAIFKATKRHELDLLSVPIFYFAINYIFILIFMKLNWGRYYLPTIMAGKIIVAVGIYELGALIHQRVPRFSFHSRLIPDSGREDAE